MVELPSMISVSIDEVPKLSLIATERKFASSSFAILQ